MAKFTNITEVSRKAGGQASNSIVSSEAIVDQYIEETEGWIMSEVKKEDLVDNYDDLDDSVKEHLRLITSNMAAIDVISQDFRGWDSRIDAENLIQILWGKAITALESLKEIVIKR